MSSLVTQRRVALAFLSISIVTIAFLTLSPALAGERESRWCLVCGREIVGDLLLNVALFVPLGVGLALLGMRRLRALGIALAATMAIELTQGFVLHGRFASVSDIVTNSTGALIGHALGTQWRALLFPSGRLALRLAGGAIVTWLAILAAAAWLLTPPLDPGDYRVTTIDDQAASGRTDIVRDVALLREVRDPPWTDTGDALPGPALTETGHALDEALRQRQLVLLASFRPIPDDTVIASVHRDGSPPAISIRHADGLLAVVVHTRARALYLHDPTIFWGPLGYLASTRDTLVTLAGGVDGDSIRLFALRDARVFDRSSLGLAPALWLYLLVGAGPGMRYLMPLSAFLNVVLLAPAAYWAAFALARSRHRTPHGTLGVLAALALVVVLGFAAIPRLAALAPTPGMIWIAAVVCMGAAGAAGWRAAAVRQDASDDPGSARRPESLSSPAH